MNTGAVSAIVAAIAFALQLLGFTVTGDTTTALTSLVGGTITTITTIVGLAGTAVAIWHSLRQNKTLKAAQAQNASLAASNTNLRNAAAMDSRRASK